ncbi:MAG: electron transport complex subunit RsxC [Faecalicoccus sp.]|nr:electron transport complex subunit RsxC [Faecalicoccus sp.]
MRETFMGGVHPEEKKELSRTSQLQAFYPKGEMIFPLSMHIGKPAKPIVKKNDPVLVGQVIAEADGFISANIICSCSGKVKAVDKRKTLDGRYQMCIVVENDGQFTPFEDYTTKEDIKTLSDKDILDRVKAAGIVGLGGAGFPTYVKLMPKDPNSIRYIIANGAECEPYLTCNDRMMRSYSNEIVEGMEIMLRLFPNAQGVIAIEDNKPEAIASMQRACQGKGNLSVQVFPTKYPQGGERSLIQAIAGIDFPGNMLPADVGCLVDNVGTIYAIQQAVLYKKPLYSHVMTVTGEAITEPKNFIVPDGTMMTELIEECGGIRSGVTLKKALAGGPMMGFALSSLDVPVQKTTNGITLLDVDGVEVAEQQATGCLHCGRCTTVCPQGLMPQLMSDAAEAHDYDRYEQKLYGMDCVACGCCTYICPAKRPLTQMFKQMKAEILAIRRLKSAGGAK